MDVRDNKESSNLLQHTDNLSLSDLELPDMIDQQRRRRVRRKTRPKPGPARQVSEDISTSQRNLIIIMVVFVIVAFWLVILSYALSILQTENLRLKGELKKEAVIIDHLPEDMQVWHQRTTVLEKNQSIIYEKLNEIQIAIEGLKLNFTKLTAKVDSRSDTDKYVADLGAKLEAVVGDLDETKDQFTMMQKYHTKLFDDVDKIGVHYDELSNQMQEQFASKNETLKKLQDKQAVLEAELQDAGANISTNHESLTHKTITLDQEVLAQKTYYNNLFKNLNEHFNQTEQNLMNLSNTQTVLEHSIQDVAANLSEAKNALFQETKAIHEKLTAHEGRMDEFMGQAENITVQISGIKNDWTLLKQEIVDCNTKLKTCSHNVSEQLNKGLEPEFKDPQASRG